MKTIIPPLKCQGIKTKLVPWIREVAPLQFNHWIEPFMGSGVVGFNLAPANAIFGDSNPHIIAFYNAIKSGELPVWRVREYLEREGTLLREADESGYVHYRAVRDRFNEFGAPLDFLFLSRAGFNGMMRFSKKGRWNIPFCKKANRFSQAYITKIVNQVEGVAKSIRNWEFENQSFLETISKAGRDDLIYCDPPYLGRYADYYNNWTESDEAALASALRATEAKFIVSSWHHNDFRSNSSITKYWNGFNVLTRDHFYHSGAREENRRPIVEALICNFETANIRIHNHDIQQSEEQLTLLEGERKYNEVA